MEQDIEPLMERLDRLERENSRIRRSARWMKFIMAPAIAICIAISSVPQALSKGPSLKEISAQQINLVGDGGRVLASLGTTTDGTVLTFFDSSERKTLTIGNSADGTFAGLATYDGNSIFAGTGRFRTSFGEANASNPVAGGLGFSVVDPAGKFRVAAGTTPDVTQGFLETIDPNGSTAGITDSGGAQGFFANDLNGKNRVFAGNSLDGTTFNQISFGDSNGNFEGLLGFNPILSPATTLFLSEPSGFFSVGEASDGHGVGWFLDDGNVVRLLANFDGANETIDEFSPSSVLVGHLP